MTTSMTTNRPVEDRATLVARLQNVDAPTLAAELTSELALEVQLTAELTVTFGFALNPVVQQHPPAGNADLIARLLVIRPVNDGLNKKLIKAKGARARREYRNGLISLLKVRSCIAIAILAIVGLPSFWLWHVLTDGDDW